MVIYYVTTERGEDKKGAFPSSALMKSLPNTEELRYL